MLEMRRCDYELVDDDQLIYLSTLIFSKELSMQRDFANMASGETRALIVCVCVSVGAGGGGVYSYIRVLPDEFLLKSVVFKFISKEISRAEHEYMNIHPHQLTL